uniref:Ion_trans domain-containing protein n=1 Tax=Mesocestoides corti TaxID=53468 RepID=A0A5K3EM04_MESCO
MHIQISRSTEYAKLGSVFEQATNLMATVASGSKCPCRFAQVPIHFTTGTHRVTTIIESQP